MLPVGAGRSLDWHLRVVLVGDGFQQGALLSDRDKLYSGTLACWSSTGCQHKSCSDLRFLASGAGWYSSHLGCLSCALLTVIQPPTKNNS